MIRVSVAVAVAARQEVVTLELAEGATVADALAVSQVRQRWPRIDWTRASVGVWSRPCLPQRLLRDGDRVEVYRTLAADPKEQRRARAKR